MAFNAAPFRVTEIAAGRTTLTGGSGGSGVRADTLATHTVPSPAAEHAVFRDAHVRAGRAVTVLAGPAAPAHALATVTLAVISAEQSFVSHTGEIVTLAVRPINVSVGRQMTDALPTITIASSTARRVIWGLLAGICAQHVLSALAARTHVARVAGTHPTLEGAIPIVAFGAVHVHFFLTVTVAFRSDKYF